MTPLERFGPEWQPVAEALLGIKESEDTLWFGDPRDLTVYRGIYPDHTLVMKGKLGYGGRITFSAGEKDKWIGSASIFDGSIFNSYLPSSNDEFDITRDDWECADRVVQSALRELSEELSRQISTADLDAAGRIGSPLASISVLPPDSWPFFEVTDWERGLVSGPFETTIYALHIRSSDDAGAVIDRGANVGRISIRQATARLLEKLDHDSLEASTAKQLGAFISAEWRKYNPVRALPSDDTIHRARAFVLQNRAGANGA